jgi:methylmalonyl-CoA mutase N-terminal domain/subunit
MAIFNDAQQLQKMYPTTFEAPSSDELAEVRVGSLVKICADDVERFWVIVTDVKGAKLQGTVDNDLLHSDVHQLKSDDVVSFELRHIYQIFKD